MKKYEIIREVRDDLSIERKRIYTEKYVSFLILTRYILFWVIACLLIFSISRYREVSHLKNEISGKDSLIDYFQNEIDSLKSIEYEYHLHNLIGKYSSQSGLSKLSKSEVKKLLKECDAWYPDIILAQAILESGLGTSSLSKNSNNLFGIKYIGKSSVTTQIGSFNGYGTYKNWQLSVIDRVLLDYRVFRNKPSKVEYMKFIGERYAEDETYIDKLQSILRTL